MGTGHTRSVPRAGSSDEISVGVVCLQSRRAGADGPLGVGSFGTGVLAVFVSTNGTGTGVLLAFGGAALVVALLGGRIESVEFGGTTLRLRAAAAERFSLAGYLARVLPAHAGMVPRWSKASKTDRRAPRVGMVPRCR